jgi:hypothetical protein
MVDGNLGQISGAIFSSISGQVLTTESTSGATRHNWSNSGGRHWPNIMSLEPFEMIDWHLKTLLHAGDVAHGGSVADRCLDKILHCLRVVPDDTRSKPYIVRCDLRVPHSPTQRP